MRREFSRFAGVASDKRQVASAVTDNKVTSNVRGDSERNEVESSRIGSMDRVHLNLKRWVAEDNETHCQIRDEIETRVMGLILELRRAADGRRWNG